MLTSMTQTLHASIAQTTKAGKYGREVSPTLSTKNVASKSPQSANKRSSSSFHVKKDSVNIKIDDYVANGRPLWMNELRKCHLVRTCTYTKQYSMKILRKLRRNLTSASSENLARSLKRFAILTDPSRYLIHQSITLLQLSVIIAFHLTQSVPLILQSQERKIIQLYRCLNQSLYSLDYVTRLSFNIFLEIDRARKTPGPQDYKVDEKPVKNTRFSKVSIPNDLRPMDKITPLSPGPGHYETEKRTSLMTKVETKNSIKS